MKIFSSELGEVDSCRVEHMQQSEDDEEKTIEHIRTVSEAFNDHMQPAVYNVQ